MYTDFGTQPIADCFRDVLCRYATDEASSRNQDMKYWLSRLSASQGAKKYKRVDMGERMEFYYNEEVRLHHSLDHPVIKIACVEPIAGRSPGKGRCGRQPANPSGYACAVEALCGARQGARGFAGDCATTSTQTVCLFTRVPVVL